MRTATKLTLLLTVLLLFGAARAQAQNGDRVIEGETIESGVYEASGILTARDALRQRVEALE